jgi:hypothetical protein
MVVSPRTNERRPGADIEKESAAPIFFGGIVQYKSSKEYAEKLNLLLENPVATYETFAKSVYSIGKINSYKNKHLRYGIFSFVVSVSLEFVIIVALYLHLVLES